MAELKGKRRRNYEFNHKIIRDAYIRLIKENKGRKPTDGEVSKETGLSLRTIVGHFKELVFNADTSRLRILTEDMIIAVFRAGMKGSGHSQKFWFQLMEKYVDKKDLTTGGAPMSGPVTIEVNSQETADGLPEAVKDIVKDEIQDDKSVRPDSEELPQ